MTSHHTVFLSTGFLLCVIVTSLHAQQPQPLPDHHHDVLSAINRAYREGGLTLDQKVLYMFYAGHKPERVPMRFKAGGETLPIKCGTPANIALERNQAELSPSTIAEIESMTSRRSFPETFQSPSGKFSINYETSGRDAVPSTDTSGVDGVPDYVEFVAAAADSSWRHEVERLGYTDPVLNNSPYTINIQNTVNFFGETTATGNTTEINIENDFAENFPPNTHPQGNQIGAIYVTIAHELKHAIQFAAAGWNGETDDWAEMDATLMEEVVYDNVNDYYNYIGEFQSIFRNPQISFYPASYYHITWALYFEEKFGPEFWVNVWDRIIEDPENIRMTEAMAAELGGKEAFQRAYVESHLWHYAAGPQRSAEDFGFEERREYPNPRIFRTFTGQDSTDSPEEIDIFAANYMEVNPSGSIPGFIRITVTQSALNTSLGLIAYFKDGSTEQRLLSTGKGTRSESTSWEWNKIERLGIVIANSNDEGNTKIDYTLTITSDLPETTVLNQNYPNPFSSSTTIPFTLDKEADVQLKVYDVAGRLVRTLIDEELSIGFYDPTFDSSNLASGIYIYRLVTDEETIVKKMTVIK